MGTWVDGAGKIGARVFETLGYRTRASGTLGYGTLASRTLASGALASGTYASGTCASGTWASGTYASGTWGPGTWASGIWASGIWASGTWASGTWAPGSWGIVPWVIILQLGWSSWGLWSSLLVLCEMGPVGGRMGCSPSAHVVVLRGIAWTIMGFAPGSSSCIPQHGKATQDPARRFKRHERYSGTHCWKNAATSFTLIMLAYMGIWQGFRNGWLLDLDWRGSPCLTVQNWVW